MLLDFLEQGSSKKTEEGGLKNLTVTVQILSSQLMDMLAEKLPQLESLKVDFTDLKSNNAANIPPWVGEGGGTGLGDLTREVQPCFSSPPFVLFNLTFTFSLISLGHRTISS